MIDVVVIPAAGLGTRFYPITKGFAKEMLPIIDIPTLSYMIEECIDAGIMEVILIISPSKENLKAYYDQDEISQRIKISYVYQYEQRGLGHAILMTKDIIAGRDFGVVLGDDLYVCEKPAIKQLIDDFKRVKTSIVGTMFVPNEDRVRYGMLDYEKKVHDHLFVVTDMLEKPQIHETNSNLAASGRYILTHEIFDYLANQTPGKGNEIQLTDALKRMNQKSAIHATLIDGTRFDIGSKIGYIKAILHFALKREDLKKDVLEHLKTLL